jgi:L-malate glycosyltransferase
MADETSKKLKILIINYEFPPLGGGGGVASYDLALEWAKSGEVDVLTSSFRGLPSFETVNGINIYRVRVLMRKSRDAASFISMLSYLPGGFIRGFFLFRKRRYDVINTHFAVPSGPIGYILGRIFRVPNILSLHGGDIYDPSKKMSPHRSRFFSAAVRFILNRADRIVAQSSNTRENAIKYYSPANEISIIPLAFHEPAEVKADRKDLGIGADDFVLVTIGRIVKRKSMDVLIKALGGIDDKRIKLYILGDGPEKESLSALAENLGLGGRVRFAGYVESGTKLKYLGAADLFTLVSMHEGFGIVYMEAMHFGLPIICSDNGGQLDFLADGKNALIVRVGDDEACRKAILRFRYESSLYESCSKNNRIKVRDFYAVNVADKYIKLFRQSVK